MGDRLDLIVNPFILFSLVALGAVGVSLALPRRGVNPQIFGAILAGLAAGLLILFLGFKSVNSGVKLPNVFFYVFSAAAIGSALRMVTHSRPVYAALYFILTILSTAGIFLILSAEFMAFALVIVYAGAILITYLFVIMLASQSGREGVEQGLAGYDTQSREPIAATVAAFAVLAALLTLSFRGVGQLPAAPTVSASASVIEHLPLKVEKEFRRVGLINKDEKVAYTGSGHSRAAEIDAATGIVKVTGPAGDREITKDKWPKGLEESLSTQNAEGLGFSLLREHPGIIEIAGVLLLMAMLGAVVLSRKQVEIDEEAKQSQARNLHEEVAKL